MLKRQLETLGRKENALHAALADAATGPARLMELDGQLRALVAEKDEVEARWLDVADTAG